MNQRIQALIEQSGLNVIQTQGMAHVVDGCYVVSPDKLHDFAESVVKQCMTLCESVAQDADAVAKSEYVTDAGRQLHQGQWGGAKNCTSAIQQHFEVEQ